LKARRVWSLPDRSVTQPVIGTEPRNAEARFFFSEDELPSRVALLQEHLPKSQQLLARQMKFCSTGPPACYDKLEYGREIDWHLDAVHGKRTAEAFVEVRFPSAKPGTIKSHGTQPSQHFVTLASLTLTGNDEYVQEIQRQFYSGSANPYPMGINWEAA
jgi:hypothetical protein